MEVTDEPTVRSGSRFLYRHQLKLEALQPVVHVPTAFDVTASRARVRSGLDRPPDDVRVEDLRHQFQLARRPALVVKPCHGVHVLLRHRPPVSPRRRAATSTRRAGRLAPWRGRTRAWRGWSGRRPAGVAVPGHGDYVVLTTYTEQDALCVTLFGTLPSKRRCMPLLPITSRSASHCSASRVSTSAGSPSSIIDVHSIFRLRRSSSVRLSISRTRASGLTAHCSSGSRVLDASLASSNALSRTSFASKRCAISMAASTASDAVADPSVPTATVESIGGELPILGPPCPSPQG